MKIRHFAIPVASLALVMTTANVAYAARTAALPAPGAAKGWAC